MIGLIRYLISIYKAKRRAKMEPLYKFMDRIDYYRDAIKFQPTYRRVLFVARPGIMTNCLYIIIFKLIPTKTINIASKIYWNARKIQ